MRKKISFLVFGFLVSWQIAHAQQFNTNEQYNQAMLNAKHAFEAKQYSEALLFYREAIKIKPDALLPRYKIEDIRTIYIKKEIEAQPVENVAVTNKKTESANNSEVEKQQLSQSEVIKEEASRKMNEDADKIEAELRNLHVDVIEINEEVNDEGFGKMVEVVEIEGDKEVGVAKVEPKSQNSIEGASIKNETKNLNTPKREPAEDKQVEAPTKNTQAAVHQATEPKPESKTTQPITVTKLPETSKKPEWVEQEKKRLAIAYPNTKTVEEIDKPGKHITRVIMNINNDITIYLKVNHNWGAVFYFIDEVGLDLKSINESYFNTMTNLKTYGY